MARTRRGERASLTVLDQNDERRREAPIREAGDGGIEPPVAVLETAVLPIH
jgi:hypothetical protein